MVYNIIVFWGLQQEKFFAHFQFGQAVHAQLQIQETFVQVVLAQFCKWRLQNFGLSKNC